MFAVLAETPLVNENDPDRTKRLVPVNVNGFTRNGPFSRFYRLVDSYLRIHDIMPVCHDIHYTTPGSS